MRRFLVGLGIVLTLLAIFKPRVAAITPPQKIKSGEILATSTINLVGMVAQYSLQFGINPAYSSCVVTHESHWDPSAKGDDGNSRGLWEISRIWHPEVSDAKAYNAVSSTIWSLKWIKAGHAKQWSTYWQYCSSTPIFK